MLRSYTTRFLLAAFALAACGGPEPDAAEAPPTPATAASARAAEGPVVTMYKSPTCGCCVKWGEHMAENGFTVESVDVTDLGAVKETYGIPPSLQACHTAVVDGYVIEGHVPAEDVRRLLDEQPEAGGLAVPGMPIGSPGMEVEGRPADRYDVLLIRDGSPTVFATH